MLTQAAAPSGAAPCNAAQRNARAYSKPHRHHAPLTSSSTPLTGGLALRNVRRPPSPEPAVAFQYAETEVETAFGSEDESQQHVSSSASELAERHLKLFRPVGSGISRGHPRRAGNGDADEAGQQKILTAKALWSVIRDARSTSALSKAVCRNHSAMKARHVSLALETFVALRTKKQPPGAPGSQAATPKVRQTQGLDVKQQKKLRSRQWESVRLMESHILVHAGSYSTRSLSRALVCLVELRHVNPLVFAAAEDALAARLSAHPPRHLATLLATFAKAAVPCLVLWEAAEKRILGQSIQFQPRDLAALLASCNAIPGQPQCSGELQAYLEEQVTSNLDANLTWAASASRLSPSEALPPPSALLVALRDDLTPPVGQQQQQEGSRVVRSPQSLVAAAKACVIAEEVSSAWPQSSSALPEGLLGLLTEAAEASAEHCRPQQLAELSSLLRKLGCPAPALLESLDTRSLMSAESFKPREIALAAKALSSTAGGSSSPAAAGAVVTLCEEAVRRGPRTFSPEQLAFLARSCSVAGGYPEDLLSMVARSMAKEPRSVPMRSLAMTARALADANHHAPDFFDCFADQVLVRLSETCPASLAEAVHALSKAGCRRLPSVLRALEGRAAKAVRSLKPRQTLTLVRGYRRARVPAPLLLKAAMTSAEKRESEFSSKQLAQLLLAAVREESSAAADVASVRSAVARRLECCREDSALTPQVLKFVLGAYLAAEGKDEATLRAAKASQTELRMRAAELKGLRMRPSSAVAAAESSSSCQEAASSAEPLSVQC